MAAVEQNQDSLIQRQKLSIVFNRTVTPPHYFNQKIFFPVFSFLLHVYFIYSSARSQRISRMSTRHQFLASNKQLSYCRSSQFSAKVTYFDKIQCQGKTEKKPQMKLNKQTKPKQQQQQETNTKTKPQTYKMLRFDHWYTCEKSCLQKPAVSDTL